MGHLKHRRRKSNFKHLKHPPFFSAAAIYVEGKGPSILEVLQNSSAYSQFVLIPLFWKIVNILSHKIHSGFISILMVNMSS